MCGCVNYYWDLGPVCSRLTPPVSIHFSFLRSHLTAPVNTTTPVNIFTKELTGEIKDEKNADKVVWGAIALLAATGPKKQ